MEPSIVSIAPRLCVSVLQQRRACLALAVTLATLACGGSPQSGVTPSPLEPASPPSSSSDAARYRLYGRITDRLDSSVNGARVDLVSGPDAGVTVFSMNPAL